MCGPSPCCNIWRRKGGLAPIHSMVERAKSESFDELVEWAYSTLPPEIRRLRDFPGIQVLDEPPEAVPRRQGPGKETLGLFSGIYRTQQRHDDVAGGPAFQPPTQLLRWVPRPSRGLRRAGITISDRIGLLSSHSRIPPLSQKARQRWGTLFLAAAGEKQIPPFGSE
jgi:hypothetical protein